MDQEKKAPWVNAVTKNDRERTRDRLMELITEDVGYHPDEVRGESDARLIVLALEFLAAEIEKLRDHSHSIT